MAQRRVSAAEAAALLNESGFDLSAPASPAADPLASLMNEFEDEEPVSPPPAEEQSEANAVALPPQATIPAASSSVALPPSSEPAPSEPTAALPVAEDPPQPPQATPPPAPAPSLVRHTCSACSALFEIDLPAGLNEAITACPSCGEDQLVKND